MKKSLKKFLTTTLALSFFLGTTVGLTNKTFGTSPVKVLVNGEEIDFIKYGTQPFINENGTTMLPFRSIFEQFPGYINTEQYSKYKLITFSKNYEDKIINLSLYENEDRLSMIYVIPNSYNDTYRYDDTYTWSFYDTPIVNINGRVHVPVRAISEAWGYKVDWDSETKTVFIDTTNQNIEVPSDAYNIHNNQLPLKEYEVDGTKKQFENTPEVDKPSVSLEKFQEEVVRLVNEERNKAGILPLEMDTKLNELAVIKTDDMLNNDYFSHYSPIYGSPFDMMDMYEVTYSSAAENIAYGQTTPEEVMNSWMNSEGHRENILNPDFNKIGVGYSTDEIDEIFWTQLFTG